MVIHGIVWLLQDEEKNVTESAILGNADSHLQDSSTTFPIQEEDFSFSGHKHVTTTNRQDLDFESLWAKLSTLNLKATDSSKISFLMAAD